MHRVCNADDDFPEQLFHDFAFACFAASLAARFSISGPIFSPNRFTTMSRVVK
jgi:hypothetical protein